MASYWAYTMERGELPVLTPCKTLDEAAAIRDMGKANRCARVGMTTRKASRRKAVAAVAGVCGVEPDAVQVTGQFGIDF